MNKSSKFRTFEDLECWQACRELRMFAAKVCKGLPKEEEYRLKNQILRSARSTTANLAEGYGRFHYQENIQYCRNARGSAYEVLDHFITGVGENLIAEAALSECRILVEKAISDTSNQGKNEHESTSYREEECSRL